MLNVVMRNVFAEVKQPFKPKGTYYNKYTVPISNRFFGPTVPIYNTNNS